MADTNQTTNNGTIDLRTAGNTAGASSGANSSTSGSQTTSDPAILAKFEIPESVKTQHPDIITLIIATESMNDDERQYWFQIIPIMTDEQINKLRDILINEKKQLQQLDKDYEHELKRINDKHVSQWKEFEAKEKRKKLQAAESKEEVTEKQGEEELLKKLQRL